MYLEKWYADWVDQGLPSILYLARLRLGPISWGYEAMLNGQRNARLWLADRNMPLPRVYDHALHWPSGAHGAGLRWLAPQSITRTLWQSPHGCVQWEVVVPNGAVQTADGRPCGRGYVERLALDITPWALGLRLLRWGRFCGTQHSLIWIEWQGEHALQLAVLDGNDVPLVSASRSQVCTATLQLDLVDAHEIMHDPLGGGALRPLGCLRRLATPGFLAGVETKWLAHARLHLNGQTVDEGHAIYEEVQWP